MTSSHLTDRQSDHLEELARAWQATKGIDTKFDEFESELVDAIRRGAKKVMVFAFFVRTIEYLERRLQDLVVDGSACLGPQDLRRHQGRGSTLDHQPVPDRQKGRKS